MKNIKPIVYDLRQSGERRRIKMCRIILYVSVCFKSFLFYLLLYGDDDAYYYMHLINFLYLLLLCEVKKENLKFFKVILKFYMYVRCRTRAMKMFKRVKNCIFIFERLCGKINSQKYVYFIIFN